MGKWQTFLPYIRTPPTAMNWGNSGLSLNPVYVLHIRKIKNDGKKANLNTEYKLKPMRLTVYQIDKVTTKEKRIK